MGSIETSGPRRLQVRFRAESRLRGGFNKERGQPCPRELDLKPGTRGHGCPRSNLESALSWPVGDRKEVAKATLALIARKPLLGSCHNFRRRLWHAKASALQSQPDKTFHSKDTHERS